MKRSLLFLFCFLCLINCFSQNRNNTWYFGDHAGINFNTNPPTALNNSAMSTNEGSATICDNNGQILFYTNGVYVWNRNHQLMPNGTGLLGHTSSTQSALIIPKPCNNNIYYIFTTPAEDFIIPLCYSIVDMTLDGGLGDVVTKNTPLHTPVTERLTGRLKPNGIDYWVLSQAYNENGFLAYTVSDAGVDPVPVISHSGIPSTSILDDLGYMRLSPDGRKLAKVSLYGNGTTELFDFDNVTGIVSNGITLPAFVAYGVEFSPDNSRLYTSTANSPFILTQYNLLAGTAIAIQNSGVEIINLYIVNGSAQYGGALKIGPDNKIYVNRLGHSYLGIINQPNALGLACNYIDQGLDLSPGYCLDGLPNNLPEYSACFCFPAANVSSNVMICHGQTYQLPSGTIVNEAGTYQDTIRNQVSCDSIITTVQVIVNDISTTTQSDSIYAGESCMLPSGQAVNLPGIYQSVLTNSLGCDSIITTTLILKKSIAECITLKNAITPNGDGINDYWILYRDNCFKRLEVNVYNRYGSLVYHSDDYKNDWNGKYKNKELPDGTYYYVMKVITLDGKEHVFKDNVTIMR